MTQPGYSSTSGGYGEYDSSDTHATGTERGSRRKKLAGYLKAANELRQTYQQSAFGTRDQQEDDLPAIPGSFPDVAIATHGDEQLVLFPS